ncbi:ATP-binding protein [Micromonospora sp. DT47]|uniref:ATP-binding protein n=1 Tax=Micromonospora sp. DT47 TaxID=3393431 RepID=UPI003CED8841
MVTQVLLRLSLDLPRDAGTVAMARRALDGALAGVGFEDDCRGDIQLALSEACANVIAHAVAAVDYTVDVTVDGDRCVIEVSDQGGGFVPSLSAMPGQSATSGRGLPIVAALVDDLDVVSNTGTGTLLRFAKRLAWAGYNQHARQRPD